jgi:hypothetical protein
MNHRSFNIAIVLALVSLSGPALASDPMGGLGEALGLINVIVFLVVFLVAALIILIPISAIALVCILFRLLSAEEGSPRGDGKG